MQYSKSSNTIEEPSNRVSDVFYHNKYRIGMYVLPADIKRLSQDNPRHQEEQREAKQNIFSEMLSELLNYW